MIGRTRLFWLVALLGASPSWAQSDSSRPPSFGGCVRLILLYLCASRRDREIGGWLLYYYVQLYLGVLVLVVTTAASWETYLRAPGRATRGWCCCSNWALRSASGSLSPFGRVEALAFRRQLQQGAR
jgi:hypothetical protein